MCVSFVLGVFVCVFVCCSFVVVCFIVRFLLCAFVRVFVRLYVFSCVGCVFRLFVISARVFFPFVSISFLYLFPFVFLRVYVFSCGVMRVRSFFMRFRALFLCLYECSCVFDLFLCVSVHPQRAQEQDIPFGNPLTLIKGLRPCSRPHRGFRVLDA